MRHVRLVTRVAGSLGVVAMIIVGCTSITDGSATVDSAEAPVYRASVSASLEASVSSSVARESERQQSLTTQAIHTACETLSSSSVDAISAVNAYVDAFNENASDVNAMAVPAVEALNNSADLVSTSLSGPVSPELNDALRAWADGARGVATAISGHYGPDRFNVAVEKLNDAKTHALTLCDAAY